MRTGDPPPGLLEPGRGFGKVWREELGGADSAIGWALHGERGPFQGTVQEFEQGSMLANDREVIYLLYQDGTWKEVERIESLRWAKVSDRALLRPKVSRSQFSK